MGGATFSSCSAISTGSLVNGTEDLQGNGSIMRAVLGEHLDNKRTTARSAYATCEEVNNSGWAVSTLGAALWAFNTTETFEEGMISAVNLGGDSDSIGAVFGQLAGAYYGFEAIPERWVKAVKTWQSVDELINRLIDRLDE